MPQVRETILVAVAGRNSNILNDTRKVYLIYKYIWHPWLSLVVSKPNLAGGVWHSLFCLGASFQHHKLPPTFMPASCTCLEIQAQSQLGQQISEVWTKRRSGHSPVWTRGSPTDWQAPFTWGGIQQGTGSGWESGDGLSPSTQPHHWAIQGCSEHSDQSQGFPNLSPGARCSPKQASIWPAANRWCSINQTHQRRYGVLKVFWRLGRLPAPSNSLKNITFWFSKNKPQK